MARKMAFSARRLRDLVRLRVGQAGSTRPLSRCYGFDRGTPIDRFYIEGFLASQSADIRGRVLEVGDDSYSRHFGGDRIAKQDVLHIHDRNPVATIVGDLADPAALPSASFDCIILTQTLQYVFDLRAAVGNVRQALRPGGIALITVPAISPMFEDEWRESHYWLFTPASVHRLLAKEFEGGKIDVATFGNLYAATAFLRGAAVEEVSKKKLREVDLDFPVTITARAVA